MIELQNKIMFKILLLSLLYSVFRYNIFNNVSWQDLPLYVFNKAIALSIILLLFYNQISDQREKHVVDTGIGITLLVIAHITMSIILQSPEYYIKFYIGQKLNLTGSLSLLFGILAFLLFCFTILVSFIKSNDTFTQNRGNIEKIKISTLFLIGFHLFVMGINGWLEPSTWPGYMPPISLVSFIFIFATFTKNILNVRQKYQA